MLVKAKRCFGGKVNMITNQIKDIPEKEAKALIDAEYVEEIKKNTVEKNPSSKTVKKGLKDVKNK